MRVISQNGCMSIEFEKNTFERIDSRICVHDNRLPAYETMTIGFYNSDDRAAEVFKEMHETYVNEMLNLPEVDLFYLPRE